MKSFKIRENHIIIDGVLYGPTPSEVKIKGKAGTIQSIGIQNRGQFFPISGQFDDGTIPVTEDSAGIMEDVKPIKKTRKTK